jgi:O-antigen/teichoic acid export membrane protein
VQIGMGVLSFAVPTVVALYSPDLAQIVMAITLCRVGGWLVYVYLCVKVVPGLDFGWHARREWVRALVTFGGWMSVCNVTDPVFLYSDRLILGALMSPIAVAYYATPFDTVTRLWIIPDAVNSAVFPVYAAGLEDARERVLVLLERAAHYIFPMILVPVLFVVIFAREILTVWINPQFGAHSATLLAWLAVGVFFSSMGRIPWTLLIAYRPDLPAKLVLFEAPLYVLILYVMIRLWGLQGAAMAYTGRSAFNCSMVHAMTWRTLPGSFRAIRQNIWLLGIGVAFAAGGALLPHGATARSLYCFAATAVVLSLTWFWLMSAQERAELSFAIQWRPWSRSGIRQRSLRA